MEQATAQVDESRFFQKNKAVEPICSNPRHDRKALAAGELLCRLFAAYPALKEKKIIKKLREIF